MIRGEIMKSHISAVAVQSAIIIILLVPFSVAPGIFSPVAAQTGKTVAPAAPAQKGFVTAEEAANALILAAEGFDVAALKEILGPDGADLVSSDDPVRDKTYAQDFSAKAREKKTVTVDPKNPNLAILSVGESDWPLPIPIVRKEGKWVFDAKRGREEVLFRRIGSNELNAIEVCRGFVEAQFEYASIIRDGTGIAQYAQRLISTPGKQDGLYWTNADGTPGGPISEKVAKAIDEGYSLAPDSAYRGYYFHILKGQGPAAPQGELDYVIKGVMIGGFAMISTPVE
jgi:hypothetical protein